MAVADESFQAYNQWYAEERDLSVWWCLHNWPVSVSSFLIVFDHLEMCYTDMEKRKLRFPTYVNIIERFLCIARKV